MKKLLILLSLMYLPLPCFAQYRNEYPLQMVQPRVYVLNYGTPEMERAVYGDKEQRKKDAEIAKKHFEEKKEQEKAEEEKRRENDPMLDMVSGSAQYAKYQQQQYDKFQEEQETKRRKNDPIGCFIDDLRGKFFK